MKRSVAKSESRNAYGGLLAGVVDLLEKARRAAARSVNAVMTATYWEIGRRIVEFEQRGARRAEYGERVLEQLSADLGQRFGRGFSRQNLQYMRVFYLTHVDTPIRQTMSGESGLGAAAAKGAASGGVERRKCQTASGKLTEQKSATVSRKLDFSDLSEALPLPWSHYVRLLSVERRLRVGNEWYRIDLLFFHRRLRCLIVIDLKVGKFTHADAGQMNLYLNYAREHWTHAGENPPVGLILCAEKDSAVAHYALGNLRNTVLAREYRLALPDEQRLVDELERTRRTLEARSRHE